MTAHDRPTLSVNLAGRTVLIVEDSPDSRELLSMSFSLLGARPSTAGSVAEALRDFTIHRPDLLVCDIRLPDGTGMDLVRWVRTLPRSAGGRVPCIAITGQPDIFPATRAIGFDAYMKKPVDLAKLCTVALALLGAADG